MARSSGDTLSLNNLAGALGQTQNSNVSLDTLNSSKGTQVSIDEYGIDSVGQTLSGYTYAVEGTNETYEVTFGGGGSKFSNIRNRGANFTWKITPVYDTDGDTGYIQLESSVIIQIKLQLVL